MKTLLFNQHNITPSKIVCIGRNYIEHIEELNNEIPESPVIFIKPNSAISQDILLKGNDEIHFEAEIAFVIENKQIKGVGIALDLTKRQVQQKLKAKGLPWELAKAFDNSAVLSPFVNIETTDNLTLELNIDNTLRQHADSNLMINQPQLLIDYIQQTITLEDNDILLTGTPRGVGVVKSGSLFSAQLKQHGQLLLTASWQVQSSN